MHVEIIGHYQRSNFCDNINFKFDKLNLLLSNYISYIFTHQSVLILILFFK